MPLITEERIYGKIEHDVCTGNAEAFADDSNVISRASQAAILNIREIVLEFGRISGLKCNVDKSIILVTGTDGVVPEYITQSGFKCADTINILGLEIGRDLSQVTNIFNKPLEKIEKIANFWNKFRLSLMGRITVAKSLLLSQLTYAGSILVPTVQQINKAESIINDFIVADMRISKKMVSVSKNKGGLGMLNLANFFAGLQCSWIKRCFDANIDNWQNTIMISCNNVISALDKRDIVKEDHPVLFGIIGAFSKFKECFYKHNENFYQSHIFGNPLLINSL
jgi:hypothetical protein